MTKRANAHLSKKQIEELEEILLDEIRRLKSSNSVSKKSCTTIIDDRKDSVDEANQDLLIAANTRQMNRENLYLKKIYKSLEQVSKGDYGICEECGAKIPFARLKARITSTLCIVCKEESEQAEFKSVFGRRSKSLGQVIQMA